MLPSKYAEALPALKCAKLAFGGITALLEKTGKSLGISPDALMPFVVFPNMFQALEVYASLPPELLIGIGVMDIDFDPKEVWFKLITVGGDTVSVKVCDGGSLRLRRRDGTGKAVKQLFHISFNAAPKAIAAIME